MPDSRTPRRFITVSSTMNPRQSSTEYGARAGKADTKFSTPEAIDTATVIT